MGKITLTEEWTKAGTAVTDAKAVLKENGRAVEEDDAADAKADDDEGRGAGRAPGRKLLPQPARGRTFRARCPWRIGVRGVRCAPLRTSGTARTWFGAARPGSARRG